MAQPKLKGTTTIIALKQPNSALRSKQYRKQKSHAKASNQTSDNAQNCDNEPNPICRRFPTLSVCGCTRPCRLAVKMVQIFEIIPGLFVGAVHGAYKHSYLQKKNVKRILNVSNEKYFQNEDLFEYLQIHIEDDVNTDITPYFEKTNVFIDEALSANQGVYVHCRAGISRSPSFIIAYLMWKRSIGFKEADKIVGRVHPDAHPNSSFVHQLEGYRKFLQQQQEMDDHETTSYCDEQDSNMQDEHQEENKTQSK